MEIKPARVKFELSKADRKKENKAIYKLLHHEYDGYLVFNKIEPTKYVLSMLMDKRPS